MTGNLRARRLAQAVGVLTVFAVVGWTLRDRMPAPASVLDALRTADPRWLLAAAAAQFVSMGMYARQQRRLLTAFGVTMPRHRALALEGYSAFSGRGPPGACGGRLADAEPGRTQQREATHQSE